MSTAELITISVIYDVMLVASSVWWLFTIRSAYDRCCSVLLLPLLVLIAISISRRNSSQGYTSIPIRANLATLVLVLLLAYFHSYWDFSFILHGKEYLAAVQSIKIDELDFSEEDGVGFSLPQQYRDLSGYGEIYVTQDKDHQNILIIFPNTPPDLDGLLNAHIYVPGKMTASLPEKCLSGRPVKPHYENWFSCVIGINQIK